MTATTTNGLTYMQGTDPMGDVDDIMQQLAEDVDNKVLATWATYVPVWSASGAAPNMGATGSISGRYRQRGRTVDWRVKLVLGGAGLSAGSGNYNLTLPVVPIAAWDDCCIGAATLFDSSAGAAAGRFGASAFYNGAMQFRIALGGTAGGVWTALAPFVPAAGDIFTAAGTYEV